MFKTVKNQILVNTQELKYINWMFYTFQVYEISWVREILGLLQRQRERRRRRETEVERDRGGERQRRRETEAARDGNRERRGRRETEAERDGGGERRSEWRRRQRATDRMETEAETDGSNGGGERRIDGFNRDFFFF